MTDLQNVWCCVGDEIEFCCQVTKSKYEVVWQLNGKAIDTKKSKSRFATSSDGCQRTLRLKSAKLRDQGRISALCEGVSSIATLKVVPIGIDVPPTDVRIYETETAVFTCISNKDDAKVLT